MFSRILQRAIWVSQNLNIPHAVWAMGTVQFTTSWWFLTLPKGVSRYSHTVQHSARHSRTRHLELFTCILPFSMPPTLQPPYLILQTLILVPQVGSLCPVLFAPSYAVIWKVFPVREQGWSWDSPVCISLLWDHSPVLSVVQCLNKAAS